MKLIYGITVSTEKEEVIRLIEFIKSNCDDDIVVQIDSKNGTDEFFMEIAKLTYRVYVTEFKNNFSDFKNQLNDACISYDADYIVQLDADEMVTKKFVKNIKDIIKQNMDNTDLIYLPRINKVDGITQEHLIKWNWVSNKFEKHINEKIIDTDSDEYKFLKNNGYIIEENKI